MGFTFVSMIIAGGLLGWGTVWVLGTMNDAWLDHERKFIAGGAICGIIVGMTDFIRTSLRAIRENNK